MDPILIRAVYTVDPPFVFPCARNIKTLLHNMERVYYPNSTEDCDFAGIDVDFFHELTSSLNLNVDLVEAVGYFFNGGPSTLTIGESLMRNTADLSLMMLTLSSNRTRMVPKFSITANSEVLAFIYKNDEIVDVDQFLAFQPFQIAVWVVIVGFLVLLSLLKRFYISEAIKARAMLFLIFGILFSVLLGLYDSRLTVFLYAKKRTHAPFNNADQLITLIEKKSMRFALNSNSTTAFAYVSGTLETYTTPGIKTRMESAFQTNPPLIDKSTSRILDVIADPNGENIVFITYSRLIPYYTYRYCGRFAYLLPKLDNPDYLVFYYAMDPRRHRGLRRFDNIVGPSLGYMYADIVSSYANSRARKCNTSSETVPTGIPRSIGLHDSIGSFIILGSGLVFGFLILCSEWMFVKLI